MSGHRIVDAAIRCYPGWWRALYADEVGRLADDLLADGRSARGLAADLFGGAVATRVSGRGMPMQPDLLAQRARVSIAVATLAWLATVPFLLLGTEVPSRPRGFSGEAHFILAGSIGTQVLTDCYEVIRLAVLATLFVGYMGWFEMRRGIRAAPSSTRAQLAAVWAPVIVFCSLAGLYAARQSERPSTTMHYVPRGSRPPLRVVTSRGDAAVAHALFVSEWVVLFVGTAASVVLLAAVVRRCDVRLPSIVSGRKVSAALCLGLAVMTVCAVAGSIASLFHGVTLTAIGAGSAAMAPLPPHAVPVTVKLTVAGPRWVLLAVVLSLASAVSIAGWRSSRDATRVLSRIAGY